MKSRLVSNHATPVDAVTPAKVRKVAAPAPEAAPDRVQVTWYVSPSEHQRLRMFCAEHRIPLQHMLDDGLSLMLEKYGQPPLAAVNRKAKAEAAAPAPKRRAARPEVADASEIAPDAPPARRARRGHAIPAYQTEAAPVADAPARAATAARRKG